MQSIVLLDNNKDAILEIKEAVLKYSGIFSVKMDFIHCRSANELGGYVVSGKKFAMIVVNKVLEPQELNTFHGSFARIKGEVPLLVVINEQEGFVSRRFNKNRIVFNAVVTKDFVFDCLRLYLADDERKMDGRIFREILLSVCDVLYKNTKEKMVPSNVIESKAKAEKHGISGVLAFYGEGIKGTLLINTSLELIQHFATKILYCDHSDLTTEMVDDVMGEISNQVLGIVRNALGEYGYKLNSSMQLVVSGKDHIFQPSSTGHYYVLPFSAKNLSFQVTFCYDTYPIKLNRKKISDHKNTKRILDIRLLNDMISIIPKTIESNTKLKVKREKIEALKAESHITQSLHVVHGRSDEGGYLVAVDIPDATARQFVKKMLFCEEDDINQDMIVDAVGELVSQIQGNQKKSSEQYGYTFQNIFHCSFSSEGSLQYLMKNPGHYCRILFRTETGEPFTCCFGMDSSFAPAIFDSSDIIKSLKL